ncbi:MAG: hypothetical protein M1827_001555 [Pycnora praestabilis]|nr:MAG: hypothetical protein M1827_001555 [Pycnora praestabilis]
MSAVTIAETKPEPEPAPVQTILECTFTDCSASFDSADDLKRHKINTPEHEYCKKCNEDFKDDEAFLLHKVKSPKHICCPICSDDFKSEGGRDRHSHMHDQDLKCVGCNERFTRAGGLMAHVETDRCQKIKKQDFEQRRAKKELLKVYLENPGEHNYFSANSIPRTLGGVPLKQESLLDADDDDGSSMSSKVLLPQVVNPKPPHAPREVTSPSLLSDATQWPKLDLEAFRDRDEDDLLTGWNDMSINEVNDTSSARGGSQRSMAKLFPNAPTTPASADWKKPATTTKEEDAKNFEENGFDENPFHPKSKRFKAKYFLNPIIRKYKCPHPNCGQIFKSATALIQHCESPSNRCKINKTVNYDQAIDLFSGGILETKGRYADGTIKYAATEPIW